MTKIQSNSNTSVTKTVLIYFKAPEESNEKVSSYTLFEILRKFSITFFRGITGWRKSSDTSY